MSCFRPLRGRLWGVCDTPLRPGMCGPSKNCLVFVPFGAVCEAYSIRPYNRVCAILRNTDAISQPDTCCPSKNHPVFVPLRGRLWGVCDTPLQSGTCDSSKYRCNAPIGYVRFFEMPMRSPDWVRARVQKMDLYTPPSVAYGGAYTIRPYDRVCAAIQKTVLFSSLFGAVGWGVYDTLLRPGTCGPSKNYPVFVPFGAACGAYAIRPYNRVRAALQKTVSFSSPTGPLVGRIAYTPTTGYV